MSTYSIGALLALQMKMEQPVTTHPFHFPESVHMHGHLLQFYSLRTQYEMDNIREMSKMAAIVCGV